jgi:hypothetical protein
VYLEDRSSAVWVERTLCSLGPVQAWLLRSSFDLLLPGSIEPGSVPLMLLSSPAEYRPTNSGARERRSAERRSLRAPLLGFPSLQRIRRKESVVPGDACPGTFRSQGFSPSQRLTPPCASRACFIPKRSWDSPFRAFPSGRAVHLSVPVTLLLFSCARIHG